MTSTTIRHLILVLGDQLNHDNPALRDIDPAQDRILMVECTGEGAQVWSHKARIALFLSAMRHFAQALRERGLEVAYWQLGSHPHAQLEEAWEAAVRDWRPQKIVVCEPGEWRLEQALLDLSRRHHVPLALREDTHFLISRADFQRWAGTKTTLLMETFYRMMRTTTGVLMEGRLPVGGGWNFDKENRGAFGKQGPQGLPERLRFAPDAVTTAVMQEVERHFPEHPGSLAAFHWPVTRAQALEALRHFIADCLPDFGTYQDAMWTGEPFLYHALLASSMNLKLLDPREIIAAATKAHAAGHAPLPAVEGFIRQILGWREFIRGVYWRDMPTMKDANFFKHATPLPRWWWTGDTQMQCLRHAIGQTLEHGYAHHIQRLMVTGNFALVAGLVPQQVADWYLAVYVDAVEWVELPNVAGMALFANGGRFTTKPYAASGAYIKRMSNYCSNCRYQFDRKSGADACPMTVFYWDFLDRNETVLAKNTRTLLMMKNLQRLSDEERAAIRLQAQALRDDIESI